MHVYIIQLHIYIYIFCWDICTYIPVVSDPIVPVYSRPWLVITILGTCANHGLRPHENEVKL